MTSASCLTRRNPPTLIPRASGTASRPERLRQPAMEDGPMSGSADALDGSTRVSGKNLDAAFGQLQQYALALDNPPLLVVCDLDRFVIRTNWTNAVSNKHEFALEDLRDARNLQKLKWIMSDPEKLRPGMTRQDLTKDAAAEFAALAGSLRSAEARSAKSRAFHQSAGVLHVRRGCRPPAEQDVRPHASSGEGEANRVSETSFHSVHGNERWRAGRV